MIPKFGGRGTCSAIVPEHLFSRIVHGFLHRKKTRRSDEGPAYRGRWRVLDAIHIRRDGGQRSPVRKISRYTDAPGATRREEAGEETVEGEDGQGPGWRVAAPGSWPLDSTSVGRWPVSDMLRGLSPLCIRVHRPSSTDAHATHVTPRMQPPPPPRR